LVWPERLWLAIGRVDPDGFWECGSRGNDVHRTLGLRVESDGTGLNDLSKHFAPLGCAS
jgi:hypothetical protein